MEIRNMTTFLRVAELQSFSQAAVQLGYSQSAVTIQIQQLEKELGVQLFERIGKHIKLTEQGEKYTIYVVEVLNTIQAAKANVGKNEAPVGTLKIGVIESLSTSLMPPILREFHRLCPQVETSVKTGLNTDMYRMVQQNEIDLIYFLDQQIYRPEWIKVIERPEPIVFVASSEHPLTKQKNVQINDVLTQPLVLTEKGFSYRYDLEQILAAQGYELHPVLEMGNTDVIVKMLLDNVGISFLPLFVVKKYVEMGELSIVKTSWLNIKMWSQLVYHKNKWLTPQMQAFLDIMKQYAS